jgi:hypothetical protein
MALYKCNCGETREISRAIIGLRDGKWVTTNAICELCGLYMDSEPEEGMPTLIRTEESLTRNSKRDKLWKGAKEKLLGERGINENFD